MSVTFKVDEIVFAKVKGFAPWPAKIFGAVGKKFNVIFYGTKETAVVQQKELYKYLENVKDFAKKYQKKKDYSVAINEANNELKDNSFISNNDENTILEDELNDVTIKSEVSDIPQSKQNKTDISMVVENGVDTSQNDNLSERSLNNKYELYFKFEKFNTNLAKIEESIQKYLKGEENNGNRQPVLVCRFSNGEFFGVTFYDINTVNAPFEDNELKQSIDDTFQYYDEFYTFIKDKFENRNSKDIKDEIAWWDDINRQLILPSELLSSLSPEQNSYFYDLILYFQNKYVFQFLHTEQRLLTLEFEIRESFGLDYQKINFDKGLNKMKEVKSIKDFDSLILKKNEILEETFRKLSKYVGNLNQWNLKPKELEEFEKKTLFIRKEAEEILTNFKSICGLGPKVDLKKYLLAEKQKLLNFVGDLEESQFRNLVYYPGTIESHFFKLNENLKMNLKFK